jgi:hypothetical protein
MTRHLGITVTLALALPAIPLRAAEKPLVGTASQSVMVWTSDDLEKLHALDLISIVGRIDEEEPASTSPTEPYRRRQDPEWYAVQAAKLRDELESRQAQLREYR